MREIKLKFIGFNNSFNPEDSVIYKVLREYCNVKITDDADYIICGCYGVDYDFCKCPQVRIMIVGENYIPDYNLIDYSISNYDLKLFDRNFYSPQLIAGYFGERRSIENSHRRSGSEVIKEKTRFANFICSHESEHNIRGDFFKKLCEYKKVDSVGTYLNNNGEIKVSWKDDSKISFQRTCKFSLCFESTVHQGFHTEKILDAFYADTVPIYYGDPLIDRIINPKAFVNCSKFDSFEDAIKFIIELDNNDDLYIEMLNQPIFLEEGYITRIENERKQFIRHIFDQPLNQAYRRSLAYWPKRYNDYLVLVGKEYKKRRNFFLRLYPLLKRVFNKIKHIWRQ